MATQKILIDPMIPHYQNSVKTDDVNSKGGKSSHDTSLIPKNNDFEAVEPDTIELKAANEANDRLKNDPMSDDLREAEKEGIREALKETVKENRKNTFKFFGLMNKSEKMVFRLKNIVPVLTGEIVIDTTKITIIHRPFFFSERIHAISVKDITDVYVETAPFFGTLNVVDQNFAENIVQIKWLWKKEAEKARRIITGLMAASKEEVDLKTVEDDALDEKLEQIGRLRDTKTSVSKA